MFVGYYYVIVIKTGQRTIGFYDGDDYCPWSIVASDAIFSSEEIEVLGKVPDLLA